MAQRRREAPGRHLVLNPGSLPQAEFSNSRPSATLQRDGSACGGITVSGGSRDPDSFVTLKLSRRPFCRRVLARVSDRSRSLAFPDIGNPARLEERRERAPIAPRHK